MNIQIWHSILKWNPLLYIILKEKEMFLRFDIWDALITSFV